MKWIPYDINTKNSKCSLFCFPYAGGNSSIFRQWKEFFSTDIAVHPIELPGRGRRFNESAYVTMDSLMEDLVKWFLNSVTNDFALFGHSLGALISFELAKRLEKENRIPKLLIVSGCSSPFDRNRKRQEENQVSRTDAELLQTLKKFKGTSEELLQNLDFLKIILPIFKADISIIDSYFASTTVKLKCQILAFGGNNDQEVPLNTIEGWKNCTNNESHIKILEGDHFFIHANEQILINTIQSQLQKLL